MKIRVLPLTRHIRLVRPEDAPVGGNRTSFNFYHRNRHVINPFNFLVVTASIILLLAPFKRETWITITTLLIFLAYLRIRVLQIGQRLAIRRTAPARAREHDPVRVQLRINHFSAFLTPRIRIQERFSGTKKSRLEILLPEGLKPGELRTVEYDAICDAGMGQHTLGPLTLSIADPLGIFEVELTDESTQEITVYPKVDALPAQKIPGSPDSHHFGNLDVFSRGHSSNFCGIHEYRRGDSLRKIAWRLSLRNQKLLVKDFEKVTNAEISLILDMNPLQHGGSGSDSTWEQAKDAVLAIAAQQLPLGNSVQLISQGLNIPFGKGDAHFDRIATELFPLFPWNCRGALGTLSLDEIPYNSSALLFLPFARQDGEGAIDVVRRLLTREISVTCVFFHSLTFALPKVHGTALQAVSASFPHVDQSLQALIQRLRTWEVPTHLVSQGVPIQTAFLKQAGGRK